MRTDISQVPFVSLNLSEKQTVLPCCGPRSLLPFTRFFLLLSRVKHCITPADNVSALMWMMLNVVFYDCIVRSPVHNTRFEIIHVVFNERKPRILLWG